MNFSNMLKAALLLLLTPVQATYTGSDSFEWAVDSDTEVKYITVYNKWYSGPSLKDRYIEITVKKVLSDQTYDELYNSGWFASSKTINLSDFSLEEGQKLLILQRDCEGNTTNLGVYVKYHNPEPSWPTSSCGLKLKADCTKTGCNWWTAENNTSKICDSRRGLRGSLGDEDEKPHIVVSNKEEREKEGL